MQTELRRSRGADQRGVVPRLLRDRVWKLLQPAVVRVASVVHLRARREDDLDALDGLVSCGQFRDRCSVQRKRLALRLTAREVTVVQEFRPRLSVNAARKLLEGRLHEVEAFALFAGDEKIEELDLRPSAVEREDHRLLRDDAVIARATVAPRFEIMRGGHMPLRPMLLLAFEGYARFVLVKPVPDHRHVLQQLREFQIRGRIECRVSTEDEDRLDVPARNFLRNIRDGRHRLAGSLATDDRRAEPAERRIDRMHERLHRRRLAIADEHEHLAFFRDEILRRLRDPLALIRGERRSLRELRNDRLQPLVASLVSDDFSELARNIRDHAGLHAQPVIGHTARRRVAVLHDVEPVHLLLGRAAF